MPPTRSRAGGLAAATALVLSGALAVPAMAADSPEAAVNELVDAVTSGDFTAIDTLVCEAEREAVRAQLDPSEAMGLGGDDLPISFRIEDRTVELVSEDGDTATLALTGTMSIDVATEDIEAIAMQMLVAEMGELSELSDEEMEGIEGMLSLVQMAFSQSSPLDEEITVVREDGEWVVCGGFGEAVEDDTGFEDDFGDFGAVPAEGVCMLATPEELTEVGMLEYLDSSGWDLTTCTYQNWEVGHSTNVTVVLDADAEYAAGAYGYDQEVEVAGARGFTSSQPNSQLLVQVGPDMLNVQVWPPQEVPDGYDWLQQTTAVAEVFVPRVPESREALIAPVKPLLCDLGFAEDFEAAMGLPLHSGNVSSDTCNYESLDAMRVRASVSQGQLEDFLMFYPDSEETTIAGLPAIEVKDDFNESAFTVRVQLPGSEQVLDMTVEPSSYDKPMSVSGAEVSELLTQHIVDRLAE